MKIESRFPKMVGLRLGVMVLFVILSVRHGECAIGPLPSHVEQGGRLELLRETQALQISDEAKKEAISDLARRKSTFSFPVWTVPTMANVQGQFGAFFKTSPSRRTCRRGDRDWSRRRCCRNTGYNLSGSGRGDSGSDAIECDRILGWSGAETRSVNRDLRANGTAVRRKLNDRNLTRTLARNREKITDRIIVIGCAFPCPINHTHQAIKFVVKVSNRSIVELCIYRDRNGTRGSDRAQVICGFRR